MATLVERPSPNHDARPAGRPIDMLIIHYTGMTSAEAALARLCDPAAKVSAHYLIDGAGRTYQLVDEGCRAWHAGISGWDGETDINGLSIGVELDNPGHEWGYRPFPEAQMEALIELAGGILTRHPIPAHRVLGHSDVAPARKTDPGELFDWPRLAAAGIGLWPVPDPAAEVADLDPETARRALAAFGYHGVDDDLAIVLTAFQRHFRPGRIDGRYDRDCAARLLDLIARRG